MIDIECAVQEGCIPDEIREDLSGSINEAFDQIFGIEHEPISINCIEVPKGFGFRFLQLPHTLEG